MRTPTKLFFISLLSAACTAESLPPSPYDDSFGEGTDPINPTDGGGSESDSGTNTDDASVSDAGSGDAGEMSDAGQPDVPPLIPKTDCDSPQLLTSDFDARFEVGLASNEKGSAVLGWAMDELGKQYTRTYRDGTWRDEEELTSQALSSTTLGVDDIGGTYAFWWGEKGLTGSKLETNEETWDDGDALDEQDDVPMHPEPYVVSPNGVCLFVRDGVTTRSIVRYASNLSFLDELEIEAPSASYERDELTNLASSEAGQAVVLTTWRANMERRLVPYFQDADRMKDASYLAIEASFATDQLAAVVVPSGDLAVVASEITETDGRLWVRRVAHDSGKWSKETELEKRDIAGRRFGLRAALADARGMLTVAWLDDEEIMITQESENGFSQPTAIKVENPDSAAFALDRDGNLSIVYEDSRGLSLRQLSARDGELLPPVPLTNHAASLTRITHDGQNNVIVVWEEDGLRSTTCREQTIGE